MEQVKRHYDEACKLLPEDRIVGVFLQGSQNYGLDYEGSDIDTKCIVLPIWKQKTYDDEFIPKQAYAFLPIWRTKLSATYTY
jgi:hypothetical protein